MTDDVDLLRRAAAKARKLADAAVSPTRWEAGERCSWEAEGNPVVRDGAECDGGFAYPEGAALAAAMGPTVAWAVADWPGSLIYSYESFGADYEIHAQPKALALAHSILR
ncbi:hypothetical protein [Jiangella gansuensis]|uniref:hypothetical protein n=1 Tax=Jiangella gansuensis TaxID=281473 RepID=UPI00047D3D8B|nr:hypothetical protein [Jiangella gansuensis]